MWQARCFTSAKNLIPSKAYCLINETLHLKEIQVSRSLSCPLSLETDYTYSYICSFHRVEQQPICSYLEKIVSKNMDLMERKLTDYIDRQIQALQTHIDNKMVLLMDLVQNSKPNKISQAHYDSNEGFSNGER